MPRSKDPDAYPSGYRKLLAAGFNSTTPLRIPYVTKTEAHRKRASLYAFINAVDKRETAMNIEWDYRDTPKYRQVGIRVEPAGPNGYYLVLTNKNFTEDELATQAFLAGLPEDMLDLKSTAPDAPAMADVLAAIAKAEAEDAGDSPVNGLPNGPADASPQSDGPAVFDFSSMFKPDASTARSGTAGSDKSADAEGDSK